MQDGDGEARLLIISFTWSCLLREMIRLTMFFLKNYHLRVGRSSLNLGYFGIFSNIMVAGRAHVRVQNELHEKKTLPIQTPSTTQRKEKGVSIKIISFYWLLRSWSSSSSLAKKTKMFEFLCISPNTECGNHLCGYAVSLSRYCCPCHGSGGQKHKCYHLFPPHS